MRAGRVAKILLAVVFVALLATPLVLKRLAARREAGKTKLDASQALTRYGFHFQEVAQASGISFVHQAPTLDSEARSHHASGCIDGRGCFGCRF